MSFDAHANFALSAVAVAPSPAASGTTLTVTAGQGALFPVVPFNCTVWPTGSTATFTNAEIVRVTNITGDVLTITRTQESTNARSILVGDLIANTMTKKIWVDVEAPRIIPFIHADMESGPYTTTSAALVDIPDSTVTLANTIATTAFITAELELSISGGGNGATIAVAVSIDGVDGDQAQTTLATSGSIMSMTRTEASEAGLLSPGTHTFKLRWRRVSGTSTPQITYGEISVQMMQVL